MTRASTAIIALALSVFMACSGDTGPQGPDGPQGPTGPEGPIAVPPMITGISPGWGSALTTVTLTGMNFSATAADDHVTFDGVDATVVSATATKLVVRPSIATDDDMFVVVNVEVANQVSNGVVFELVASGTAKQMPVMLPSNPTSVVGVGSDLYIAAGFGVSPLSGLYKRDANGVVRRVLAARALPNPSGNGPQTIYDGPIALATDGTNVYYVTLFGAVRRYEVVGGETQELLGPSLGGNVFPPRTALTFDSSGNLFVLDRNAGGTNGAGVIEISSTGAVRLAVNTGIGSGGWGLASDGTDLFATSSGLLLKITGAASNSPSVTIHAEGSVPAGGVTVIGTDVVISESDGTLASIPAATSGTVAPYRDSGGYGHLAQGLWASSGGDLYLAQSDSSAVREIASGETDATIVAAGVRAALSTLAVGGDLYFATMGDSLFNDKVGAAPAAPDAAILRVNADGSSQVVQTGELIAGLLDEGSGSLTVSDCLAGRIYSLDVASGAETDILTSTDGLDCPAGMYRDTGGDLFYVNTDLSGTNNSTVGKLSGSTNDTSFISGLPNGIIYLGGDGTRLLMSGLGVGNAARPIFRADPSAGGDATELVSIGVASGAAGLSIGPNGLAYLVRVALGDIIEIEPTSGEATPVGSTLIDGLANLQGGGSIGLSLGFLPDGTKLMLDPAQGVLAAIAP